MFNILPSRGVGGGRGGTPDVKRREWWTFWGRGVVGLESFHFRIFFSCSKQSDENSCKYKAAYGGLIWVLTKWYTATWLLMKLVVSHSVYTHGPSVSGCIHEGLRGLYIKQTNTAIHFPREVWFFSQLNHPRCLKSGELPTTRILYLCIF